MWISIHKSALSRHTVCRLSVVPITIIIFITIRYDAAECRYYSDFSIRQVISIDARSSCCGSISQFSPRQQMSRPKEIIYYCCYYYTFHLNFEFRHSRSRRTIVDSLAVHHHYIRYFTIIIQIRKTISICDKMRRARALRKFRINGLWAMTWQNIQLRKRIESVENSQRELSEFHTTVQSLESRRCPMFVPKSSVVAPTRQWNATAFPFAIVVF